MSATGRAACVYAALTLLLAFPLSFHPAGSVISDAPDTNLYIWTLAWDTHAATTAPWSIFDANIFYPRRNTLAFSENLLGDLPFAAPVIWLTHNPVLAMNLVALASALLCAIGGFLLGRRLGLSDPAAFIAGVVYGFAPSRFLRLDQIHLTTVEWIPFALAYLLGYLDHGRKRDLRLAIAFFVLQALTSGHGAIFVAVAVAVVLLWRLVSGEPVTFGRRIRDAGLPGFAMIAALACLAIPYLMAQRDVGLRRTLENWSVPAASFLASPTHVDVRLLSLFSAQWINDSAEAYLFPGWLPLVLVILALVPRRLRRTASRAAPAAVSARTVAALVLEGVAALAILVASVVLVGGPLRWRSAIGMISIRTSDRAWIVAGLCVALRWTLRVRGIQILTALRAGAGCAIAWARAHRRDPRPPFAMLAIVTLWLSAGPPIGLWPAVYWLPGMNFIRGPSRFMILFVLAIAVLAGVGIDRLAGARPARGRIVATICGALMVVEFAAFPFAISPLDIQPPPIDRWLAAQSKPFSIVELPLPDPADAGPFARRQTTFMLYSFAHWQKMVNGYSGITPPEHQALFSELSKFPTRAGIDALNALGVTYVVIHTDLYDPAEWARVERALGAFPDLRLAHVAGAGRAYAFTH